jgi:phosphatidylglycerol:prolipoprotein diacylglycerol transferase
VHPFLFSVFGFHVPTYGLFSVAALLVATAISRRYARVEGLDPTRMTDAIVLTCAVGLVGARLLEVAVNWRRYFVEPGGLELLPFSTGVFLGAVVTAVPFGYFWLRRLGVPILQGLDILGLVGVAALGVGRWGCFFSGCCWGTPTDLPWAVTFPEAGRRLHRGLPPDPIHPTQIYESLLALAILGVLTAVYPRKRFHGQIILMFLGLYSIGRFGLEFVRGDAERGFLFGGLVSTSQFIGLGLVALSAVSWVILGRRQRASTDGI